MGLSRTMQCVYCMQNKAARKPTISLRLTPRLIREIDDLVKRTGVRSRTDFIERAVEAYAQEFRTAKVVVLRPWTESAAKSAVLKFLRSRPSAYVSEIVEALRMDPEMAWRVVDALAEEGKVE